MATQGQFLLEYGGNTLFLQPGETLVGSGAECAVRVTGEKVEPVHAAVQVEDGRVVLQVRASAGDVTVNGSPVRVGELKAGDRVKFGDIELTLQGTGAHLSLTGAKGSFNLRVGENKVGRSPDNGVAIEDTSVSRSHAAVLMLPSGVLRVRDLGSSNGTFINDRRLGERELSHGDKVELGGQQLVLLRAPEVGAAAAAAAPARPTLELLVQGKARLLADGVLRIGRAPDCEVSLPDDNLISRYHAQVAVSGAQARLKDLGSSNGTRLNGEPVAADVVLKDGDRIGVGSQEFVFKATVPVDPMGATVIAGKLPLPSRTTLMPKVSGAAGAQPAAGGREAALARLELAASASPEQIQKRYQELYSDFQIRLTNAPTPELKKTYTHKLEELRNAFELLAPESAPRAGATDLPSPEPVEAPAGGPAGPSPAAPVPVAAKAVRPVGKRGIPASTLVVLVLAVVAMLATGAFFVMWQAAARIERAVQAEFDAKQQAVQAMQARLPVAQKELEGLRAGRAPLMENKEFKICNLSSRELVVGWVHATWLGDDGDFESFDSAYHGYPTWRIAPGGTAKFEWVSGDQVLWDGSAVFFSVLLDYAGLEIFRSGGIPQLQTDCYSMDLDQ